MFKWQFTVPINPEPWTIGPVGYTTKGGRPRGFVGVNQQLRNYQDAIRTYLKDRVRAIPGGDELFPLKMPLDVKFWFWRRLDNYELESGKKHNRHWADATNMQKALEDAIQGIITGNDRENYRISSEIVHQGKDVSPGIVIELRPAEPFEPGQTIGWQTYKEALSMFADADKFTFDNKV